MAIHIKYNQISSRHSLIYKTADHGGYYHVICTGIVTPKFKNTDPYGKKWIRTDLTVDIKLPTHRIPKPHSNAVLRAKHWTVYGGLNSIFDNGGLNGKALNSGHAVDSFGLLNPSNLTPHIAKVRFRLAVKGVGNRAQTNQYPNIKHTSVLESLAFKINLLVYYA